MMQTTTARYSGSGPDGRPQYLLRPRGTLTYPASPANRFYSYSYSTGMGMGMGRLGRMSLGSDATLHNIQVGGTLAASAATAVVSTIAAHGGMVLGLAASNLAPIIGPAIAGITMAVIALAKGCGDTCIVASNYANEAEALLKDNIRAYFATPAPRSQTAQTVALANFDTIWAALQRACGTPALASAGERCISDRQSGACHWHADSNSPYPGGPVQGACWNWFSGYRDPIANDPQAVPDSQLLTSSTTGNPSATGSGGGEAQAGAQGVDSGIGLPTPLILGGLLLAAVMFMGD